MTSPPQLERDLTATVAVTMYSLVVAAGFARVFSGWEFMADLAVLVVLGHGASFALRRLRTPGWISIPFVCLLLVWALLVQQFRATLSWLLPTAETWDQLRVELDLVRDQFQTAVAPVFYGAGWATLAGFAVVVAVVLADAFAFRASARGEALVPGGVLFVFIAALGSERLRITLTVLLVAAGVITVATLRSLHDRRRQVELRAERSGGFGVVPTALGTAAIVAVLAGFLGPRLPSAGAEPLYDTKGGSGGVTNIVSPLVDIRSRLTNQGDAELFRVDAGQPAYWRVTTLPAFDGRRYRLPERRLERIDDAPTVDDRSPQLRQQVQVVSLGGVLVPAAADPIAAEGTSDGERLDLRQNVDTNSLLAPDELTPGDLFRILSARPAPTPDALRAATSSAPPDEIFVELPDDLPDVVDELAREVTAGAATPYDQVMALQDWFRDPDEFRYSTEIQSGHGNNAIESFFNERAGYCEQFAATFATMARSLGIPSRVAVGFTPGVLNEEGWYSVIGKNAHAWPEIWFDGIGWVAFEPTPGRGAPGAESYTGVPAQQDESGPTGGAGGDPSASTSPPTPTTAVVPSTSVAPGGDTATTLPGGGQGRLNLPPEDLFTAGGEPEEDSGLPWPVTLPIVLVVGGLAAPFLVRLARSRRDRRGELADRVVRAWGRACTSAEQAGVRGSPALTAQEWVAATAAQLPVAARPMASLAHVVDQVSFRRPGEVDLERKGAYGSTLGHDCELWADQIGRIALDTLTTKQRVKRYFTSWR
jgi:transglutaminase-like putative cysteine protease